MESQVFILLHIRWLIQKNFTLPLETNLISLFFSLIGSAGTWQQGFYAFGYVVLTLEAYFIRDWRTLTFFSILPSFVVLFIFKTIPESPRWLASQGKIKEAEHILRKIGKENGSRNNEVIFLKVDSRTEGKTSQHGTLDLFTHRSVCPVTGIMMLSWCVNTDDGVLWTCFEC